MKKGIYDKSTSSVDDEITVALNELIKVVREFKQDIMNKSKTSNEKWKGGFVEGVQALTLIWAQGLTTSLMPYRLNQCKAVDTLRNECTLFREDFSHVNFKNSIDRIKIRILRELLNDELLNEKGKDWLIDLLNNHKNILEI